MLSLLFLCLGGGQRVFHLYRTSGREGREGAEEEMEAFSMHARDPASLDRSGIRVRLRVVLGVRMVLGVRVGVTVAVRACT